MSKTDNFAKHIDDIDLRTHEERQKSWRKDFMQWYEDLQSYRKKNGVSDERVEGQLTMLSSVLWYLLDPKQYKALVKGKIYIDQSKLTAEQKKLFTSMMAFNGSPYCDKSSARTVLVSYIQRAKTSYKDLAVEHTKLARAISYNISAGANPL